MRIDNGVNENHLLIPMCFGTQQKVRKQQKPNFTLFTCRYHMTRFYRCLGYVLVVLNLSVLKIIIS